jgi:hypothetical protein
MEEVRMFDQHETHEMILNTTHPSGVEEWYCPTCGRRFLMQWPPNFKRIILDEGDENALHSGGKGGISMGVQITQDTEGDSLPVESPEAQEEDLLTNEDEELLTPWEEWINKTNFDHL